MRRLHPVCAMLLPRQTVHVEDNSSGASIREALEVGCRVSGQISFGLSAPRVVRSR